MLTLSIPPLRVGGIRTCQYSYMDGPKLQCLDPNCNIAGCQGNRVEIHTQRVYLDTDADLYKQPLPRYLEFNEPWEASPNYSPAATPPLPLEYEEPSAHGSQQRVAHAGCRLAARLLGGAAEGGPGDERSGSGTRGSDEGDSLIGDADPSSGSGTGTGGDEDGTTGGSNEGGSLISGAEPSSGSGSDGDGDEGGSTGGSNEGGSLISDAEPSSGSGSDGDGGSDGSIECEDGSGGGVAAAAGPGERLAAGAAASTGLAGQGSDSAGTRTPLMRCILVHFKTARSKKAISFILPFVVARSLHRWITHGRALLMDELGGPGAHNALFVSPASGKPMETGMALTYYWHKLQLRRKVPWTPSFPPSAMRHIYVGSRVLKLGELLQAAAVDVSADVMFMTNSLRMWEVRACRAELAPRSLQHHPHTHSTHSALAWAVNAITRSTPCTHTVAQVALLHGPLPLPRPP
jgi:hypothetical protein